MRVAFIGLGHMGEPMCRNILAAGHELIVHDIRAEAGRRAACRWRYVGAIAATGRPRR